MMYIREQIKSLDTNIENDYSALPIITRAVASALEANCLHSFP